MIEGPTEFELIAPLLVPEDGDGFTLLPEAFGVMLDNLGAIDDDRRWAPDGVHIWDLGAYVYDAECARAGLAAAGYDVIEWDVSSARPR